jgi:hypothetical protein
MEDISRNRIINVVEAIARDASEQIVEILQWVGKENYIFNGVNLWSKSQYTPDVFDIESNCVFTTEQLIQQYLKENKV